MRLGSTTLTSGGLLGFHFRELGLPPDVAVKNARLTLNRMTAAAFEATITVEDTIDSKAFSSSNFDLSSRELFEPGLAWNVDSGDASKYGFNPNRTNQLTSVDLSDYFRDFVLRPAWREDVSVSVFMSFPGSESAGFGSARNNKGACLEVTYLLRKPKSGDTFRVKHGSDDVYEASDGTVYSNNPEGTLLFDTNGVTALRFVDVNVPKMALIKRAYIVLWSNAVSEGDFRSRISVELTDSAAKFKEDTEFDVTERTLSFSDIDWIVPALGEKQKLRSPDVSGLLNAVIDQDGWMQGNAMAFIFDTYTGERRFYSNEGQYKKPTLYVEWMWDTPAPTSCFSDKNFGDSLGYGCEWYEEDPSYCPVAYLFENKGGFSALDRCECECVGQQQSTCIDERKFKNEDGETCSMFEEDPKRCREEDRIQDEATRGCCICGGGILDSCGNEICEEFED